MKNNATQYLPYVDNVSDGSFRANAEEQQTAYYTSIFPESGQGCYAYKQNIYEASPLNRVLKSFNIGQIYRDKQKAVEYTYGTNAANELLMINPTSSEEFTVTKYYPAGRLSKQAIVNEDGATMTTYKDFDGNLVLERRIGVADTLDTYYVHDHKNRLCWVISPKGSAELSQGVYSLSDPLCTQFAYYYKYNGRDLLINVSSTNYI